ncbi:hypothetical protein [Sphingomonas sp. S2-65]|uniref:hypothetical protein n=1 Tax=Sphingomonas sp. S2-65 TaxID=2903960 RepID=UPI001F3626BC|nr:hypothetical protein [Sphingomonas sp. S2-65]UYY60097.1 hypothetical protein LZ586_08475 [Sphingomonas sp. S2-65]
MPLDAQLLQQVTNLLGRRDLTQRESADWWGGAADGGPNGDGLFPLTDSAGYTRMVPSPAKMMALVAGGWQFTVDAVKAVPNAQAGDVLPATTASSAAGISLLGIDKSGALKRFTTDLFASRRTADLEAWNDARFDDLLNVTRGGIEGSLNLASIAKIANNLTINLSSPPYNVKPDFQETRDGISVAGSFFIDSPSGQFKPQDVGKVMLLSSAWLTGGGPLQSTIQEVISPTRVRIAHAPNRSSNSNRMGWGTDNTDAVRRAMADSESPGYYSRGAVVIIPQGGIMTRAFRYKARTALVGYGSGQSFFVKLPPKPETGNALDQKGVTFIRNEVVVNNQNVGGKIYKYADDYVTLMQFGVHGGRYYQPGGDAVTALEMMSTLGDQTLANVDPYWRMAFVDVWESTNDGIHTYGRSSSNVMAVNVLNCNGMGWKCESFDDNVNTLVLQANSGVGLYLGPNGGSNGNFTTVKLSYNGTGTAGQRLGSNMTIDGSGYNITGIRSQESNSSNIVIRGSRNTITGGTLEDTGCVARHHGGAVAPQAISAGIFLVHGDVNGNRLNCYGNEITSVVIGPAVHRNDSDGQFASHAVFLDGAAGYGGPQYNYIDVRTTAPFGVIRSVDGQTTVEPWQYQDYGSGAGVAGREVSTSSFNQNSIRIDGQLITD